MIVLTYELTQDLPSWEPCPVTRWHQCWPCSSAACVWGKALPMTDVEPLYLISKLVRGRNDHGAPHWLAVRLDKLIIRREEEYKIDISLEKDNQGRQWEQRRWEKREIQTTKLRVLSTIVVSGQLLPYSPPTTSECPSKCLQLGNPRHKIILKCK